MAEREQRMKRVIVPVMLGFGVTLALVIGQRMTTDAMAVVLGVAVGVAASVPTSILLVALVRRAQREAAGALEPAPARYALPAQPAAQHHRAQPGGHAGTAQWPGRLPAAAAGELLQDAGLRRLRVVGDEDEWA